MAFNRTRFITQNLNRAFNHEQTVALRGAIPDTLTCWTRADQTVTNSITPVAISNLFVELEAENYYGFRLFAGATIPVTNGIRIDFNGGNATATTFIARVAFWTDAASPQYESCTALNTSVSSVAAGTGLSAEGTILVNRQGTFQPTFAQQVATGSTVILAGAWMQVFRLGKRYEVTQ
jgi:hypothetical protein